MMANIIKTISALARGYMLFTVNNKKYLTYAQALKARKELSKHGAYYIKFMGFNIFKGWVCFYYKSTVCIKEL